MIKFLEVKRAYYADPENVVVQVSANIDGPWFAWPEGCEPDWNNLIFCRIRPRTIRIGEIDVPEPVRNRLCAGQKYFIGDYGSPELYGSTTWRDDAQDARWLSRGLIHLTKEAAIEHAKALIIVSGGKV